MTDELPQQYFGPHLTVAACSCTGVGPLARSENQDNYLMIDVHGIARYLYDEQPCQLGVAGWPAGHARVAVLDGMGGHGRGREAAQAVAEGVAAIPACDTIAALTLHLDDLHARLQASFAVDSDPDRRPGTTLTLIELPASGPALLYHVGDSRLYRISADKVEPLTVDHVPATAFAMQGLIGERAWWQQVHGEHRPQISQAFILGNAFDDLARLSDPLHGLTARELPSWLGHLPDRRAITLDADALYVLATDGFWSCGDPAAWVSRWPALMAGASDASAALRALFETMVNDPPASLHPDNLTAVVLAPRMPSSL